MSMIFQLTTALQKDIYIKLFVTLQVHKHSHFDPCLAFAESAETFAKM